MTKRRKYKLNRAVGFKVPKEKPVPPKIVAEPKTWKPRPYRADIDG